FNHSRTAISRRNPADPRCTHPTQWTLRAGVILVNRLRILGLALFVSGFLTHPAQAQKKAPGGAKVFLLSGGQRQHHGYRDQAFYLADAIENTGRYEVTIGEDAAILETPALRKYDLVIANADRRDPEFKYTRAQQEALLDY